MGDLWHENILVSIDQHHLCLYILNLQGQGYQAQKPACLGSHGLLSRGCQIASELASVIQRSFRDAYSRTSDQDARLSQDTLAHSRASYVSRAPRSDVRENRKHPKPNLKHQALPTGMMQTARVPTRSKGCFEFPEPRSTRVCRAQCTRLVKTVIRSVWGVWGCTDSSAVHVPRFSMHTPLLN